MEWSNIEKIGQVLGGLLVGLYGALKIFERKARQDALHTDAEIGSESSRVLVQRAEARMKEMHELRNSISEILNGFAVRLVSVEKDMQRIDSTLDEIKASTRLNEQTLQKILLRVSALGGGRRLSPNETDPVV